MHLELWICTVIILNLSQYLQVNDFSFVMH